MLARLTSLLLRPIDSAWLVAARIGVGFLLAIEMTGSLALGYLREYTEPQFNFSYLLFDWLPRWPPAVIIGLHLGAITGGVAVAAGWHFRWAARLLTLCYTLVFLAEQTRFINHIYLYCLVAGLLSLMPAHHAASADVRAGRVHPSATVPAWTRYILVFQLSLVYFFAGVAKVNPDWLMARPLTVWLTAKSGYPIIGGVLGHPLLPWLMSYGGVLFDLLVVPLMLWRRTRPWAFGAAVFFHVSNVVVFGLGTFPWFSMLLTAAVYFSPGWPRRLPGRLGAWFRSRVPVPTPAELAPALSAPHRPHLLLAGLGLYALIQLLLPLRPWLYPGDVHWTEEGHQFSWHMMLRVKEGTLNYRVVLPDGREELVSPSSYLTFQQSRKLVGQPDYILQFAHFLAADYARRGLGPVAVYAESNVVLNRRPGRPIVARTVNLAAETRSLGHYGWITPAPPLE
ncbi:HTTM domain-containing protein [Hymenobacter sp. BT175]|uniref:HTTM domain-containing protein n=1 Tax=Hymenobacter translucens TaxID=2886507 RepID=UPI001D0EA4FB|nr:HTTM domain-containing protein [Hymenobacter translucens]MCC2548455.1 HTTM domain-containing protein [Hymenobacter translucens]